MLINDEFLYFQINPDDVTAIIHHFGHMLTLLLMDLQELTQSKEDKRSYMPPNTPMFDYLLGEEILDTVLQWSLGTGEFTNMLKLEQLKLYEALLSQCRQEVLVYKGEVNTI